MIRLFQFFSLVIVGIFLLTALPGSAVACCNDFMNATLRKDLDAVKYSNDYKVSLFNGAKPSYTTFGQYTTAWLAFDLAYCPPNPQLYQCQFSQVGFWTNAQGTRWFVYAEPGVTCYRGSHPDARSCLGDFGDLVSLGRWTIFEMVHYYWFENTWIVRVYDQNTRGYDVARISSNSSTIYDAWSTAEEIYSSDPDPYLMLQYWHYHPQYIIWGTGFFDWPATGSSGEHNTLYMIPASICPNYAGRTNLGGDGRFWYTGVYASQCSADPLF